MTISLIVGAFSIVLFYLFRTPRLKRNGQPLRYVSIHIQGHVTPKKENICYILIQINILLEAISLLMNNQTSSKHTPPRREWYSLLTGPPQALFMVRRMRTIIRLRNFSNFSTVITTRGCDQ